MEAFAERGFTATSMREIALALGMTQQGLTHHFPSKDALLESVLEQRDQRGLDQHRAAHLPVADTLRAIVAENVEKAGLVRLSTTLAAEAINPRHPAHNFFDDHYSRAREVFATLLSRGQESGEVRSDLSADQLATLVVSILEGLQLQWLIDPELDMTAGIETAIRVLEPPREPIT
jgi:AcrR family transcriptional regulator